jgi:hypothetical protein
MANLRRDKHWADFVAWCKSRKLRPLPAHPWTLAAYMRWCEIHCRQPNIAKRVKSIARAHLYHCAASPDRHPTVTRTLRMIEVRHRTQAKRAALFRAEDFAVPEQSKSPGQSNSKDAKTRNNTARKRSRRALRSSPHLVSRRPSAD